jgi:WD40 repeat protein
LIAVAGGTPAQWGTVALIDPAAGYQVRILCDLPETALCLAFSPDGKLLVAGAGDRTTRFFDTATGKQKRVLRQHADWVQTVAFSPDGTHIVSASRDRTVRVFDAAKGEIESTYMGHDTAVLAAAFNSRGTGVISLGVKAKALHEWEAKANPGKPRLIDLPGETSQWASLGFAWAYVGAEGAIRVEQLSDRRLLFTLLGHRDTIQSLAIPPQSSPTSFATGAADGEVRVWNLGCGTDALRFIAAP